MPTADLLPAFPLTILVAVPEHLIVLDGMRKDADLLTVTAMKASPQHGHRLRGRERQRASRPQHRDGEEEEGRAAAAPICKRQTAAQQQCHPRTRAQLPQTDSPSGLLLRLFRRFSMDVLYPPQLVSTRYVYKSQSQIRRGWGNNKEYMRGAHPLPCNVFRYRADMMHLHSTFLLTLGMLSRALQR